MGTQNGMNGLPTAMPGITAMTSGPATPQQNWNAAFGALYISNVDLNLYQFGAQRARVAAANAQYEQDSRQLDQEVFQVQARVATAYLNTLVAVQLRQVAQRNLDRTVELQKTIEARTLNGLNPGVDSSLADAEVSRARLALLDAIDVETVQGRQLSIAMGVDVHTPTLDSSMVRRPPQGLFPSTDTVPDSHPVLQFLQSRVTTSEYNTRFIWRAAMPRVGFFGVLQERGSGYGTYYGNNFKDYTTSYWTGVSPARANYMFGIGISWDLTQAYRTRSQMKAAQFRTTGLRQEMLLEKNLLSNQASLANDELRTAIDKYNEAPIQLNAASSAYDQK
jgi:outer membrane protein TolC